MYTCVLDDPVERHASVAHLFPGLLGLALLAGAEGLER